MAYIHSSSNFKMENGEKKEVKTVLLKAVGSAYDNDCEIELSILQEDTWQKIYICQVSLQFPRELDVEVTNRFISNWWNSTSIRTSHKINIERRVDTTYGGEEDEILLSWDGQEKPINVIDFVYNVNQLAHEELEKLLTWEWWKEVDIN